ncbi:MAG: hypothetical protein L0I76_32660 [Pseudonocardia sp.]|nr:hypothetical protein [Pseudonocardia sp.]
MPDPVLGDRARRVRTRVRVVRDRVTLDGGRVHPQQPVRSAGGTHDLIGIGLVHRDGVDPFPRCRVEPGGGPYQYGRPDAGLHQQLHDPRPDVAGGW